MSTTDYVVNVVEESKRIEELDNATDIGLEELSLC